MKVIILAGGYGTRLAEYTQDIPKPMVNIGDEPILTHIMRIFSSYGFNNFIVAAGYKKESIFNYYKNSVEIQKEFPNLEIVDTGKDTMTGGRILKLKPYFDKFEIIHQFESKRGQTKISKYSLWLVNNYHGKNL